MNGMTNPPPELNDRTFPELFEACRPRASQERWTEIPWVGDLWEGRFDRRERRFSRFDLMAVGTRWGGTTFNVRYDDVEPAPMGVAFTLAGREARDRTPPHASPGRYFEA